jgi:hypothetical protein
MSTTTYSPPAALPAHPAWLARFLGALAVKVDFQA